MPQHTHQQGFRCYIFVLMQNEAKVPAVYCSQPTASSPKHLLYADQHHASLACTENTTATACCPGKQTGTRLGPRSDPNVDLALLALSVEWVFVHL
jgi:hypothetical protein